MNIILVNITAFSKERYSLKTARIAETEIYSELESMLITSLAHALELL